MRPDMGPGEGQAREDPRGCNMIPSGGVLDGSQIIRRRPSLVGLSAEVLSTPRNAREPPARRSEGAGRRGRTTGQPCSRPGGSR